MALVRLTSSVVFELEPRTKLTRACADQGSFLANLARL